MAVLVGMAIFVGFFAGVAHAAQQSTGEAENTLTADINQERAVRGLGSLAVASDLVALAEQHSADMAAVGHPYHDPNIRSKVQNWQELGDNVGTGPDADHLHQAFMNSQVHRDEILKPTYTQVGVGAYWAGNVLWVTEIFRLPEQPSTATPAPPRVVVARIVAVRSVERAPAPPPTPTPGTTGAPAAATPRPAASGPSTSMATAAAQAWPPVPLRGLDVASRTAADQRIPAVAVAAAVLLLLVVGVEVQATPWRRRHRR
ncbi:MAG: CAP domain-containing protein [Acidimicrobiia bacterium]|nr:CAP domain-containing protein [Acidimicrobiia bacterium]